jgi:hypothetical protein
LRADGFIIRAQATIRTDGFRPRKFGEDLRVAEKRLARCARQPRPNFSDKTIRKI